LKQWRGHSLGYKTVSPERLIEAHCSRRKTDRISEARPERLNPYRAQKLVYDRKQSAVDEDEHSGCSDDDDVDRLTEVDKYFSFAFDCKELLPLQFWKSQASEKKMLKLSVIARSVYAISASQNRSESVRSAAQTRF